MQHLYNPDYQNQNLAVRSVAALDKVSDTLKALLWSGQKQSGLSPLQLKLLLFIAYHEAKYNTISQLVEEFQVTKATISDCIKALEKQKLLSKVLNHKDNRRFHIELTEKGTQKVSEIKPFANPLIQVLQSENNEDLETLYNSMFSILSKLNKDKKLNLKRSCSDCKAYRSDGINHAFCMELRTQLKPKDRRIDCPKYQSN